MSLLKRGTNYTSMVWVEGVRYSKALHTGNKRLAEKLDQTFKEELYQREFQQPQFNPEMTFGEVFSRFLAEADVKAFHTERAKYFLGFFADMKLGRITRNDVIRYRKQRHAEFVTRQKVPGRKLTETTVNRDLEVVRRVLFWAADEGIIQHNPLARMPMVRERRRRRPVMSVADEVKFLAHAAPHLARIVNIALFTGMRRGEILAQRWEHIDFDRRLLSVTHSKTAEGEHREIPLSSQLMAILEANRVPQGFVVTYDGEPLHRIKTAWAGTIRRASIPYVRFHDLRHTFNSRLVEVEVIADVRKELMGHSHGGDVHSIYTHVELPQLRVAIDRLDAWHKAQVEAVNKRFPEADSSASQPQTSGSITA
jgi:integrase